MIGRDGERLVIPVTLAKVSTYEREIREETRVVWRYQFWTDKHERVVYSGKYMGRIKEGDKLHLRCTVKEYDRQWNCTRVKRPVIVEPPETPLFA